MRLRKLPGNVHYERDPIWERSREFKRLVGTLLADEDAKLPGGLTDAQRVAIETEVAVRRWPDIGLTRADLRTALERAMNETRQRVVAPRSTDLTDDVIAAWRQDEGRELWQRIMGDLPMRKASAPAMQFALGVMLATGGMRTTPHILPARDLVLNNAKLFDLVTELALGCEGVARHAPAPKSYGHVLRLLPALSEGLAGHAQITLMQIAATYSSWGIPAGRYLLVDGSMVPAWTRQLSSHVKGKPSAAREKYLRRRSPEAGYKVYSRTYEHENRSARGTAMQTRRYQRIERAVRGYSLATLVDIATGLTLAFDLRDLSNSHEPKILREVLLPKLFALNPHLQVDAIVGDAKYDDDTTHEYLETHYGIHLVVARGPHAYKQTQRIDEKVYRSVHVVSGRGVAKCREHRAQLKFLGLDPPPRRGLEPGESTRAGAFRSRFECPVHDGCGRVSFPTRLCWSELPHYPYTPNGRHDLWAFRRAFLSKRNGVESSYSSNQVGYKVGLDGSARTHFYSRTTYEALFAIAAVTRALLALYGERIRRGELSP